MNILLLNWQDISHPLGGGAEVHYHEIFRRLVARGHAVTLFCSAYPGAAREEAMDGIRVIREGGRNTFNFAVVSRYRSRFRHEAYDIVVDDLNKIPFFTPWYVREPLLTIVHHLFGGSIFREAGIPAASYVWSAEQLALQAYRNVPFAAVSESTKRELASKGIPEENISLVMNAVDPSVYHPVRLRTDSRLTVGYLGRIKQYKSVDHLLRAFADVRRLVPGVRLLVVGDGDARPGLESLAQTLGIAGDVSFEGYVDEQTKVRLLSGCDLVVNPSAKEGWGLTVIEANACGVPVIAADVPGLRDSVVAGETGVLYPYGDIGRLTREMVALLQEPERRTKLAAGALAWSKKFTWEASADAMERVLRNTIERHSSGG